MILLDTETTDLNQIGIVPLDAQPRIIEVGLMKVNDRTLKEEDRLTFLVNPGIPIPEKVTKITGLTDADVVGAKRFPAHYLSLVNFFLGERILVGHNLPYDVAMFKHELTRMDKLLMFPWPYQHICTVERTQDLTGKFRSLTDLYLHYFKKDPEQTHRGMGDVEILYAVVKAMRKEGRL